MDYINLYAKFLRKSLEPKRPLRVIMDCSNGTTGLVLEKLLRGNKLIDYKLINANPDGNFPAHGPNPLASGAAVQLEREVKKRRADLGIIFDADGDRVFFVDNRGRLTDAHEIGFALMQMFKPPYVVSTIASWRLKKVRGAVLSPVGHYFFKNIMRRKKASVGLEHSGHFYFRDFFWCDSGILSAILIMNFVSGLENGLADWLDALPKYYRSGEINFKVSDKQIILDKIKKKYAGMVTKTGNSDGLTMEFGNNFWINVRPSNTENLLRLNVEAKTRKTLETELKKIRKVITLK